MIERRIKIIRDPDPTGVLAQRSPSLRRLRANEPGHGLSSPRDEDFFALLDFRDEPRKMRFRLVDVDLDHEVKLD
jgi:hypothetical protein